MGLTTVQRDRAACDVSDSDAESKATVMMGDFCAIKCCFGK